MAAPSLLRALALAAVLAAPAAFALGDRCPVDGTPCTAGASAPAAPVSASGAGQIDLAAAALLLAQVASAAHAGPSPALQRAMSVSPSREGHSGTSVSPFHLAARPITYLTDVSADGELISKKLGPVRPSQYVQRAGLALGGLAVLLATVLSILVLRGTPAQRNVASTSVPAATEPPVPVVDQGTTPQVGQQGASWSDLVLATGGDPARAAAVISGVVAADPSVPPHSNEAIARALKLVSGPAALSPA